MIHDLTDEECCAAHVIIPGKDEVPGQCRRCRNCKRWVRPKDRDGECLAASQEEIASHDTSDMEWVSVEERLPNWGEPVIAYFPRHKQVIPAWRGHGYWDVGDESMTLPGDAASHWMPMPPPPLPVNQPSSQRCAGEPPAEGSG